MGGVSTLSKQPTFYVQAQADTTPLSEIEIIKLTRVNGETKEQVISVWQAKGDNMTACIAWTDSGFDQNLAYAWYPRVKEKLVPRWSAIQCEKAGRCEEFPEMDTEIAERAWGSPIWHIPQ